MNYKNKSYLDCPECGGQPKTELAMRGCAYFTQCDQCGWEGDTRDIEICPSDALEHWYEKVLNYYKML